MNVALEHMDAIRSVPTPLDPTSAFAIQDMSLIPTSRAVLVNIIMSIIFKH